MRDPDSVINFGRHRGKSISDPKVPDKYIAWLAGRPSMKDPKNSFKTVWKCPQRLWAFAMREADKRGYKVMGERWVHKDHFSMED